MSKQMFYTTLGSKFNNPNALYVELVFDQTPEFTKSIAPLLYDKKFSYGVRLDDGLYKAFTNVFSVLYGNNIPDEQNNTHAGIRSTDGCGNDVIWAGDFAMPTDSESAHNEIQVAKIRWSTLQFARDFGFGVMYHGHETPPLTDISPSYIGEEPNVYKPAYPNGDAVYAAIKADIQNARTLLNSKLQFKPLVATVPGTAQEVRSCKLSDGTWRIPYLEEGMWCITGRKAGERLGDIVKPVPLSPGLDVNSINANWFIEPNWFPMPFHYSGATASAERLVDIKAGITEMSIASGNYAKCFFTHDVTYASDEGSRTGMTITDFKELMTWIDANYGKTSGKDEVWFASVQSVLEYIYCRVHTTINQYNENNRIILEIIPPTYVGMRRPALTFKLNSNIPVRSINIHNIDKFSQNVLNNTTGIINVEWSGEHYAAAERMVSKLESSQSIMDKLYAQTLTNLISIPTKKDLLQARINNVTIVDQTIWLFDFGRIGSSYSADAPYNLIGTTVQNQTYSSPVVFSNLIKTPSIANTLMVLTVGAGFIHEEGCNYPSIKGLIENSGAFPDRALKDAFKVPTGTYCLLTLTGLNNNKKYDFVMIPNKSYVASSTKYTIMNDLTTPTFNQNVTQANRTSTEYEANFYNTANINNAIPINGTLYIRIEGSISTHAGYINAMKITEHE